MKVTRRMTQSPEARAAILAQAQAMGISVEDFDTIERGERTMTHTPGPWHVNDNEPEDIRIEDDDELIVAATWAFVAPGRDGQEIANARLIAAAPELLAALKGLTRALDGVQPSGPVYLSITEIDAIRAAISKAE